LLGDLLSCEIVLLYVFAVFLQFNSSVFLFLFSLLVYYISVSKDYYYYTTGDALANANILRLTAISKLSVGTFMFP